MKNAAKFATFALLFLMLSLSVFAAPLSKVVSTDSNGNPVTITIEKTSFISNLLNKLNPFAISLSDSAVYPGQKVTVTFSGNWFGVLKNGVYESVTDGAFKIQTVDGVSNYLFATFNEAPGVIQYPMSFEMRADVTIPSSILPNNYNFVVVMNTPSQKEAWKDTTKFTVSTAGNVCNSKDGVTKKTVIQNSNEKLVEVTTTTFDSFCVAHNAISYETTCYGDYFITGNSNSQSYTGSAAVGCEKKGTPPATVWCLDQARTQCNERPTSCLTGETLYPGQSSCANSINSVPPVVSPPVPWWQKISGMQVALFAGIAIVGYFLLRKTGIVRF